MKFQIEDVTVYFPYDNIYPEQYSYMVELKRGLDAKGHCLLEMPNGTGRTIALLSLITSYTLSKKNNPMKLIYCTRTVHEMEKTLAELKLLHHYQVKHLGSDAKMLAVGLSSRKNLFINPATTASEPLLPPGVYSLQELRELGKAKGLCPYFLAQHQLQFANVVVCTYQHLLDPKVAGIISKDLQRESVVVFDEAHNIDNVCIEALSVSVSIQTLEGANRNMDKMIDRLKATDVNRLQVEYRRLVDGLAVPGNIRRAEHFVSALRRLVQYIRMRLETGEVEKEEPVAFVASIDSQAAIQAKTLRFCSDRLHSLMLTLEIADTNEFLHIQTVCDFATLVATYAQGFSIIGEPLDDPVLQLCCHDASLAIKPVFERFQSVVITSGTLGPIDMYSRLLNFNPVVSQSFSVSLARECICPMVLSRGSDQLPVSTKYDLRSVGKNYGKVLLEMVSVVPDGIVCFFESFSYMEGMINSWHNAGLLKEIMQHKLVFMETQDAVETTLALDNYRKACDCGRGAVFFSVAMGKVAQSIDFDRHYGRLVIVFGVPFQYTPSRRLLARLEYLRVTFQIKEVDFLRFDALRQSAQCVGRVIRSKADYGMVIFADKRYTHHDKRSKLPGWILSHLHDAHRNLSTDMAVNVAKDFLRKMALPYDMAGATGKKTLLTEAELEITGKRKLDEMMVF